jgi:hypothetical protein
MVGIRLLASCLMLQICTLWQKVTTTSHGTRPHTFNPLVLTISAYQASANHALMCHHQGETETGSI